MSRAVALGALAFSVVAGVALLGRAADAAPPSPPDPVPPAPPAPPDPPPGAPIPDDWQRWHGARPDVGAPGGTILAVPGLRQVEPEARLGLLALSAELGIPVDSLAIIIQAESGWNPHALNPLPAAGLIQLTVGAHLPPFDSADAVRAITAMSATAQLVSVVAPYYRRVPQSRGANPGKLYMLNFLPAHAGKPESFVLGRKGAPGFEGQVYERNAGFDTAKKGTITVGDVYAAAARVAAKAARARVTVSGELVLEGGEA